MSLVACQSEHKFPTMFKSVKWFQKLACYTYKIFLPITLGRRQKLSSAICIVNGLQNTYPVCDSTKDRERKAVRSDLPGVIGPKIVKRNFARSMPMYPLRFFHSLSLSLSLSFAACLSIGLSASPSERIAPRTRLRIGRVLALLRQLSAVSHVAAMLALQLELAIDAALQGRWSSQTRSRDQSDLSRVWPNADTKPIEQCINRISIVPLRYPQPVLDRMAVPGRVLSAEKLVMVGRMPLSPSLQPCIFRIL